MANKQILISVPENAWNILAENLGMDAESSNLDIQIRNEISTSLGQVKQVAVDLAQIKKRIDTIVSFYIADEESHFEECDNPDEHIFLELSALQEFANQL